MRFLDPQCLLLSQFTGEPGSERLKRVFNLRSRHPFVVGVREQWIPRPEVHCGYSERREARDIRPPDLGAGLSTDRAHEALSERSIKAGARPRREIHYFNLVGIGEERTHEGDRLVA